jgi:hypothetical protein
MIKSKPLSIQDHQKSRINALPLSFKNENDPSIESATKKDSYKRISFSRSNILKNK